MVDGPSMMGVVLWTLIAVQKFRQVRLIPIIFVHGEFRTLSPEGMLILTLKRLSSGHIHTSVKSKRPESENVPSHMTRLQVYSNFIQFNQG